MSSDHMRPMCALIPNLDIDEPIYEENDDAGMSGEAGCQEEEHERGRTKVAFSIHHYQCIWNKSVYLKTFCSIDDACSF